jgi:hypothetical protein
MEGSGTGLTAGFSRVDSGSADWADAVSLFTDSVFFGHEWLSAVTEGFGAEEFCVIARDSGKPVGVCPGAVFSKGPFRVFYSGIPYGGVDGTPEGRDRILRELPGLLGRNAAHRIRIQPLPGANLSVEGYRSIPVLFPLLDISGCGDRNLLDGLSRNPRRDVRRAIREGVEVRCASSPDDIGEFYRLYRLSQARNRAFARYPAEYFRRIAGMPCESAPVFRLAFLNGSAIAGMVTLRSGNTVHYLHGGIDYRFRSHCASDLLVFRAIEAAVSEGMDVFDFGGTSPSDETLLRYKCKWGAEAAEVPVLSLNLARIRCVLMDAAVRMLSMRPPWSLLGRGKSGRE